MGKVRVTLDCSSLDQLSDRPQFLNSLNDRERIVVNLRLMAPIGVTSIAKTAKLIGCSAENITKISRTILMKAQHWNRTNGLDGSSSIFPNSFHRSTRLMSHPLFPEAFKIFETADLRLSSLLCAYYGINQPAESALAIAERFDLTSDKQFQRLIGKGYNKLSAILALGSRGIAELNQLAEVGIPIRLTGVAVFTKQRLLSRILQLPNLEARLADYPLGHQPAADVALLKDWLGLWSKSGGRSLDNLATRLQLTKQALSCRLRRLIAWLLEGTDHRLTDRRTRADNEPVEDTVAAGKRSSPTLQDAVLSSTMLWRLIANLDTNQTLAKLLYSCWLADSQVGFTRKQLIADHQYRNQTTHYGTGYLQKKFKLLENLGLIRPIDSTHWQVTFFTLAGPPPEHLIDASD